MAELNMKRGNYDKALGELGTANTYAPTGENYKNIAKCKEMLKQISDAVNSYKDALAMVESEKGPEGKREKNTLKASILLDRGKLFMKQCKFQEAKNDFNAAIVLPDVKPESGIVAEVILFKQLYLERGKCLRELMDYKQSIDDLEIAVSKLGKANIPKRQQAHAHNELGFSYHEFGQFEKVTSFQ